MYSSSYRCLIGQNLQAWTGTEDGVSVIVTSEPYTSRPDGSLEGSF